MYAKQTCVLCGYPTRDLNRPLNNANTYFSNIRLNIKQAKYEFVSKIMFLCIAFLSDLSLVFVYSLLSDIIALDEIQ